jgi:hypothetical protein
MFLSVLFTELLDQVLGCCVKIIADFVQVFLVKNLSDFALIRLWYKPTDPINMPEMRTDKGLHLLRYLVLKFRFELHNLLIHLWLQ